MCDKKPCDNCCHEEDLLCCMPLRHCCGGYSEHNNCCPHDRCCNHPCGGCDCCDGCGDCPFGPEPCCCKAMKCCKKCKEELEKLSEKTADDIGKLNSDVDELDDKLNEEIERATTAEGDLAEAIAAEHDRAVAAETTITHNLDIEINRATNREDQIEDALEDEVKRATGVENNDLIADVEYDSVREELNFKNKKGESICTIDAHDFVIDGMLKDAYVIDYGQDKAIKFIVHTDEGDKEIIVPVGDLLREEDYYKKSVIDGKLLTLKDDVTHTLSWSGFNNGSYNGESDTSFKIPYGSVTANTGSVLNSVSINNSTGQLSGTTVALPDVPTDVGDFNNDVHYQTDTDVDTTISTAITNLTQSLSSHYDGGGEFTAVHHIGITDGLLDNTCNSIAVPHGSVNATAGQALSGITINQQTGVLTGTSIAIPAVPTLVSQLTNDAGYTIVDKIQIGPNGSVYAAAAGSDTIQIPAYPTGSTTNVTIDGTSVNLETLLNQIVDRIDALEALWTRVTDNNVTYLQPVTSTDRVRATAFYDTSVS